MSTQKGSTAQGSGFTPGPWVADPDGEPERDGGIYVYKEDVGTIAIVTDDLTEQRANARLIAAAPDLLAALEDSLDTLEGIGAFAHGVIKSVIDASCKKARAAIAKGSESGGTGLEN